MKIAKRLISLIFVLGIAFVVINANHVLADGLWDSQEGKTELKGVFGTNSETDPRLIVAGVIKIALSFIGIILVVMILLAGYKYMMAGGDETKVTEAKTQIKNAIIGLIIILMAYSIAYFITESLAEVNSDYYYI